MYDLHIHSLLSDGVLLPSEIARRYQDKGYKIIAITDHCDYSNIKNNIASIVEFCKHWPKNSSIKVLPGVELTHIPLDQYKPLVKFSRRNGIKIIVGHGESPVEPVEPGTNRAALLSGIDILAHPGNIKEEDVITAREKKVFLELTTRRGHFQGNFHVANMAKKVGANLIINNDAHMPDDIVPRSELRKLAIVAGLSETEIDSIYKIEEKFLAKLV